MYWQIIYFIFYCLKQYMRSIYSVYCEPQINTNKCPSISVSLFMYHIVFHGRVSAHGVMSLWITPSWWTQWAIYIAASAPQLCNKYRSLFHPFCEMVIISNHVVVAAGFLSRYLSGPLPYVWHHRIVKNVLSISWNKTFSSFLSSFIWC